MASAGTISMAPIDRAARTPMSQNTTTGPKK